MLKVRVIPVLLLRGGRMVKTKQFGQSGERDVGSPITTARIYDSQDADELIFLDIDATGSDHSFLATTLKDVAKSCFIPLTVGGGIRTLDDIQELLQVGADKVAINTSALEDPDFISRGATRFGNQCIVVSIDVRKGNQGYRVYSHGGKEETEREPVAWAKEAAQRGAGEILLTSIEREGMMQGYDIDLIRAVSEAVSIPVIAHGGAGTRQHFVQAVQQGRASAVAAASVFHFTDSNISQVKSFMHNGGIPVRIVS